MNVAVLMTCHNRKASTLRCLDSLCEAQVKRSGEGEQWTLDVFLNDDGSTDGTSEAVQERLGDNSPSSTPRIAPASQLASLGGYSTFSHHLIRGSGRDYWARGMARAWQAALDCEKEHLDCSPPPSTSTFSHFLWLNDDVVLKPDALSSLLHVCAANPNSVLVGELANARGEIVYGRRGDLFAGNFVLVPRSAYDKVGMICGDFHHAWADSDYAMRCKCAGVPVVSCGVVGTCEGHPNRPSLAGLPLRVRWAMLWDPKGWCVHDLWLYRRRNWGLCAAILSCAHLVLHVLKGERGE